MALGNECARPCKSRRPETAIQSRCRKEIERFIHYGEIERLNALLKNCVYNIVLYRRILRAFRYVVEGRRDAEGRFFLPARSDVAVIGGKLLIRDLEHRDRKAMARRLEEIRQHLLSCEFHEQDA